MQIEMLNLTRRAEAAERVIERRDFADLSTSTIDQNIATNPHARDMYVAPVQHDWLHLSEEPLPWNAEWAKFSTTRVKCKSETNHIQPAFCEFALALESSTWALLDTHSGLHGMTQDFTMHLKDQPASAMSIGLLIELVGQNEDGCVDHGATFPSAKHMSKLWRDMYRILHRAGFLRCVHAVITDLFQIICFRMECNPVTLEIVLTRTAIEYGEAVKRRLTDYVRSTPVQLGQQQLFKLSSSFSHIFALQDWH
jgi:hypothetical protein